VTPLGPNRIQFDFRIEGVRYRPSLRWLPNETNLHRARQLLVHVKARIAAGTFAFSESFPDFSKSPRVPLPLSGRTCTDVFDAFLDHEAARVERGDLAPATLAGHRQLLDHVWRPAIGTFSILAVRYTQLVRIADSHRWTKKTHNNAISALRRAFAFGFEDHPELYNPARALKSARIGRRDRPNIDPFSIQDAEVLIAAIHRDWGEAQSNYDEFRFFTGLRPSEEIALVVSDYDAVNGVLSITKTRVNGIDRDRTKTGDDRRVVVCARARGARATARVTRHARATRPHPSRPSVLRAEWPADSASTCRASTLAPDVEAPADSLPPALHRAPFFRELEPDDRPQPPLRRPTARPQDSHDADGVRRLDGWQHGGGYPIDPAGDARAGVRGADRARGEAASEPQLANG
jgi:integrase